MRLILGGETITLLLSLHVPNLLRRSGPRLNLSLLPAKYNLPPAFSRKLYNLIFISFQVRAGSSELKYFTASVSFHYTFRQEIFCATRTLRNCEVISRLRTSKKEEVEDGKNGHERGPLERPKVAKERFSLIDQKALSLWCAWALPRDDSSYSPSDSSLSSLLYSILESLEKLGHGPPALPH